jgi:hypothetical protein
MADPIRTLDLAALARTLEQFRRVEPDQTLSCPGPAGEAALKAVEAAHRELPKADRPDPAPVGSRRAPGPRTLPPTRLEPTDPQSVPELDEGRLLDVKV